MRREPHPGFIRNQLDTLRLRIGAAASGSRSHRLAAALRASTGPRFAKLAKRLRSSGRGASFRLTGRASVCQPDVKPRALRYPAQLARPRDIEDESAE